MRFSIEDETRVLEWARVSGAGNPRLTSPPNNRGIDMMIRQNSKPDLPGICLANTRTLEKIPRINTGNYNEQ